MSGLRWASAVDSVRAALPVGTELLTWRGSLYEDEPYCANFRDFCRRRGAAVAPLSCPLVDCPAA